MVSVPWEILDTNTTELLWFWNLLIWRENNLLNNLLSWCKLINECDNLINGLDSDLVLARSGLMGSKRQKVSNYNKEVRELIRECDEFITSIE